MKILIDMNLSPLWVGFLVSNGFEAIRWSSIGLANATDETLFAWAVTHDHLILTHDQDFNTILALKKLGKPSVVLIRTYDLLPTGIGMRVVSILRQYQSELELGAIINIEDTRIRIRELPM